MTLAEFLATVPDMTDAEAADAWNTSPYRFGDAYMTPEGLIRALGQELADVVLGSLAAASAGSPSLAFVLDRLRTSERGLNLGDPATHAMLRQLGAHPDLPLTGEQAERVIDASAIAPRTTEAVVREIKDTEAQQSALRNGMQVLADRYNAAVSILESGGSINEAIAVLGSA